MVRMVEMGILSKCERQTYRNCREEVHSLYISANKIWVVKYRNKGGQAM